MSRARLVLRRETQKDGTAGVQLIITHNGGRVKLNTGMRADRGTWERSGPSVYMAGMLAKVSALLDSLAFQGALRSMSLDELRARVEEAAGIATESRKDGEFLEHATAFIGRARATKTADAYNYTLSALRRSGRLESLKFADINYQWLTGLESWMRSEGVRTNTISLHMRNIRAIVNDAIKCGLTDFYGFRAYRIKKEETRKRSLSADDVRRLRDWPGLGPTRAMYRDLWMLSLYLQGINAADLLTATRDQVKDGRLEYRRSKTGKLMSVKIQPEALEILKRYGGERLLLSCMETHAGLHDFCRRWREALQTIGTGRRKGRAADHAPAFPGLTPYWCRHTWATLAHQAGVPLDTIARGLGHSWAVVTDIYIRYDSADVDKANRAVLDYIR